MARRILKLKDSEQGTEQIVAALSQILAAELMAWNFYFSREEFLKGVEQQRAGELFRVIAHDELYDHARLTMVRLHQLGKLTTVDMHNAREVNPVIDIPAPPCTVRATAAAIIMEAETIKFYKLLLPGLDVTTANLVEDFIQDEEEHLSNLRDLLCSVLSTGNAKGTNKICLPNANLMYSCEEGKVTIGEYVIFSDNVQQVSFPVACTYEVASCPIAVPTENFSCAPAEGGYIASNGVDCCMADSVKDAVRKLYPAKYQAVKNFFDSMIEKEINGKKVKVQEFSNAEEANKFLEANKGYVPVDKDDTGKVYVTLESQDPDKK